MPGNAEIINAKIKNICRAVNPNASGGWKLHPGFVERRNDRNIAEVTRAARVYPRRVSDKGREIYHSENGDRWLLCRDNDGRVFVSHKANQSSGGTSTKMELGDFLAAGKAGPEHQALGGPIGTLGDGRDQNDDKSETPSHDRRSIVQGEPTRIGCGVNKRGHHALMFLALLPRPMAPGSRPTHG
jgi:hypothetical protein